LLLISIIQYWPLCSFQAPSRRAVRVIRVRGLSKLSSV